MSDPKLIEYEGEISTDKAGSACPFKFSVPADASEKEVEQAAREAAFDHIEWAYRPIN